jgi:hypothetical protein
MEMTQQIKDLVDSIIDDNSVDAEKKFNDIMADRLYDRIEDYRQEVANSYFNPVAETEEESVEEVEVEDTESTEVTDETE